MKNYKAVLKVAAIAVVAVMVVKFILEKISDKVPEAEKIVSYL